MFGRERKPTARAACALISAAAFASYVTCSASAQVLHSDTQVAALAPPSAADACLQALDRPVVDAARLIARCTCYIGSVKDSPALEGAAHLVRAAVFRDLGDERRACSDDQEAVRLYSSIVGLSEPYPEFVFRRATAYHALGDVQNALRDYDIAIRGNPWNVVAFADRGILLAAHLGDYNLAAADFDRALKLAPDNVQMLIVRGDAYAAQGKYAEALTDLDRAVAFSPRDPDAYTHRASAHSRRGATGAALKDYERALSIDPDNFDALLSRAALYSESGDGRAAVADMNRALAARPGNASALYNHGYAHFVERRYAAAVADYSAAIEVRPDFAMAWNNRCLNATLAGRDKAVALADCNEAVRLLPARPDVRETRGFVHLTYGDNDAALEDYDAALKIDAGRPLSLYGRGVARTRRGDAEAGTVDKQAARTLYPNVDREFAPYGVE